MSESIHLEIEGNEARLVFDRPNSAANIFDDAVLDDLDRHLTTLEQHANLRRVILLSAKEGIFIAGADIQLIRQLVDPANAVAAARRGQQLFTRLTRLKAITVAAIDGACMGGGLEIALACKARVTTTHPKCRLALPEVQLGILPAWGGTTNLPRQLRFDRAVDLLLSGRPLDGKKALKAGLVDACCPSELLLEAARKVSPHRLSLGERLWRRWPLRGFILKQARKSVQSKTRGLYPAPLEILCLLQSNPSTAASLEAEAQALGRLATSFECKSLVRLFLSKEEADKGTPNTPDFPPVSSLAVLGAGVMGGGIAHLAARKKINSRMRDLALGGLDAGMKAARHLVDRDVKRRKLTAWEGRKIMARIHPQLTLEGMPSCRAVIEAVVENMEVKKKVLAEAESLLPPGSLLASNTSSLSISEMAQALQRPEDFVGLHFFNPVDRMPLLEIVTGEQTSPTTIERALALSRQLGKTPVVVKDGPGFLVNRLLAPYMNEAIRLVGEGVSPLHIDKVFLDWGMPMGPVRLADEVGIDVAAKVGHILEAGLGSRLASAPLADELAAAGSLGVKSGEGFYLHKGRKTAMAKRFAKLSASLPPQDILLRCWLPMVNEAALCLSEGIVEDSTQLDLAMILGTGFAPFRGGPLRAAATYGWSRIVEDMRRLERQHGTRFTPSPALVVLTEDPNVYDDAVTPTSPPPETASPVDDERTW